MSNHHPRSITEVTRQAIFKAMRQRNFLWWGDITEVELLSQVFDLKSMKSDDARQPNAASEISVHRDGYTDWPNDWIFTDSRLNLICCDDTLFLKLFEVMVHPTVQSESKEAKWLVDLLNRHLAFDGWQLVKIATISGRPVYKARQHIQAELASTPRYLTPDDVDIDLESFLYTVSRVFAHRGNTTEVAILADASAELTQVSYDNGDGGTYSYSLALRISPALYAQIAGQRSEFANIIRDETSSHFPHQRNLQEILIQPFQKAPEGWQEKAKTWVSGKGVTNQGRVRSTNIAGREHDGLLFRSQPEIHLYEALKKRGVAFAPLPVFVRGGDSYQRLEPDFIIVKDGIFAVVEVDGDTFHSESPSAARTRLKLFEDAGAYIVRVNANECGTTELAETCAEEILSDIATHKTNRR